MLNPARIPRMVEKLRALWLANPDMRLGQLIDNLVWHDNDGIEDVFLIEDTKLEERIDNPPWLK